MEWRDPRRTTNAGTCSFFAPGAANAIPASPDFMTPTALDVSVSIRTLTSFTSSLCIVHAINHRRAVDMMGRGVGRETGGMLMPAV